MQQLLHQSLYNISVMLFLFKALSYARELRDEERAGLASVQIVGKIILRTANLKF